MNLVGRYFSAHDIQLGVEASDKLTALASAAVLAESRYQIDRAQVERALWRREQTGTTAIGHGIAIPHARIAGISKPIVLFLRTGKPVKFAAPDRKPVDNLLVILVPNYATEEHLRILAAFSSLFSDAAFRWELAAAGNAAEVYRLFCDWPVE